ncbi:hypothetical protein FNJ84_19820 [Paracoccus sp. M683]|uniref:hypothetical protein n=1 Tax=Paracoccus sp. M683 TaxID=2594268 RepID=UPI00117F2614|nr:hypothetical protein [Paracoccus sp. M683]TRW94288.1 hypothetical protein FNJ84_19820 [Paracoccus sp. M683]
MTDNHTKLGGAPYAVSESGIRQLLGEGWRLEAECIESAAERHSNIFGRWAVRIVAPDESIARYLTTTRNIMEMRLFKTTNGLISFMDGLGVAGPRVPMRKGEIFVQNLSGPEEE